MQPKDTPNPHILLQSYIGTHTLELNIEFELAFVALAIEIAFNLWGVNHLWSQFLTSNGCQKKEKKKEKNCWCFKRME